MEVAVVQPWLLKLQSAQNILGGLVEGALKPVPNNLNVSI